MGLEVLEAGAPECSKRLCGTHMAAWEYASLTPYRLVAYTPASTRQKLGPGVPNLIGSTQKAPPERGFFLFWICLPRWRPQLDSNQRPAA